MARHFPDLLALLRLPEAYRSAPLRHSIIRRSLLVTGFVVLGHGFYYVLVLSANRILSPAGFGRFYAAWAILNVLVVPVSIWAMLLTSALGNAFRTAGAGAIPAVLERTARRFGPVALAIVVALELLFYFGGWIVHVDSFALVILLPVTAASFLTVETVRSAFPAMLQTAWFGASWLIWCMAQCALGAAALMLLQTAWAGFFGMLGANLLVSVALAIAVVRRGRVPPTPVASVPDLAFASLRGALPFCSALAGFVVFNNADVLAAYLFMSPAQLGAYAAAALLPKAIVTVTQPVAQMLLPMLNNIESERGGSQNALLKALAITFALAAAGAATLWGAADLVCGGRYGIEFCSRTPMTTLAVAAIFFSVLRLTILAEVGAGRYIPAHLPLLPLVGFVLLEVARPSSGGALATRYALAALASLSLMAVAGLARRMAGGSGAAQAYSPDARRTALPPRQ